MQRARTNNSEKHGKQNETGEAQKKQRQDAKNNGSNGRSEQGRMWRAYLYSPVWGQLLRAERYLELERKRQNEGTTYNEKDENDGRVTQTKQKNVEE